MIGKTIVAVDEGERGDELVLRFSDGSAALITAHSLEEADISVTNLSPGGVAKREAWLATLAVKRAEDKRWARERRGGRADAQLSRCRRV